MNEALQQKKKKKKKSKRCRKVKRLRERKKEREREKKTDAFPVAENTVSLVMVAHRDLIPLSISIDFVEDVFVASLVH